MLKGFPTKDELYTEIDYARDDIRKEMIVDLKPLFEEMTHEMIATSVSESTQQIATLISETADQITAATESKVEEEHRSCARLYEKVKT